MGNNNISKIDIDNEIPIEITNINNNDGKLVFKQKSVIVENENSSFGYIFFCLEILMEKYLLDYEEVLLLLYLNELVLFDRKIKVIERIVDLGIYLRMGYIKENYSYKKKKLYNLSDKGLDVVNDFLKTINNRDSLILENRKTEIALESKVKSVLGDYFNK